VADRPTSALYANLFRVGYNESEFVLEFCQSYDVADAPGRDPAIVSRIVITPASARELAALLEDSIRRQADLASSDRARPGRTTGQ